MLLKHDLEVNKLSINILTLGLHVIKVLPKGADNCLNIYVGMFRQFSLT